MGRERRRRKGSHAGTREIERWPLSITAGTEPARAKAEPAWLAQLKAEEERLQREDYERRMSEPLSTGDAMMLGRRVVGR